MARPKLGEGSTERLHMKISLEELQMIDDWRFANKISSRSDAVRRLCQIGIRALRSLPSISNDVAEVLYLAADAVYIPEEALENRADESDDVKFSAEIAGKLYDAVNFTYNRQVDAQDNLYHFLVEIAPFANNPELDEAIKIADRQASEEIPNEETLKAIGESRNVQLKYWRKRKAQIMADELPDPTDDAE